MYQEKNKTNNRIIKIPFSIRLAKSSQDIKDIYNEIKNEIMSYGVKSRVSASGEAFRLHCVTFIRLKIVGKKIKVFFALDPNKYANSTYPFTNVAHIKFYKDVPLAFKVKSGLSLRRCKDLITDVMNKYKIKKREFVEVDWAQKIVSEVNNTNIDKN